MSGQTSRSQSFAGNEWLECGLQGSRDQSKCVGSCDLGADEIIWAAGKMFSLCHGRESVCFCDLVCITTLQPT